MITEQELRSRVESNQHAKALQDSLPADKVNDAYKLVTAHVNGDEKAYSDVANRMHYSYKKDLENFAEFAKEHWIGVLMLLAILYLFSDDDNANRNSAPSAGGRGGDSLFGKFLKTVGMWEIGKGGAKLLWKAGKGVVKGVTYPVRLLGKAVFGGKGEVPAENVAGEAVTENAVTENAVTGEAVTGATTTAGEAVAGETLAEGATVAGEALADGAVVAGETALGAVALPVALVGATVMAGYEAYKHRNWIEQKADETVHAVEEHLKL